jgi:hypothetical protein
LCMYHLIVGHCRLEGWGSVVIPLPLQAAAFGVLGLQLHCMHA